MICAASIAGRLADSAALFELIVELRLQPASRSAIARTAATGRRGDAETRRRGDAVMRNELDEAIFVPVWLCGWCWAADCGVVYATNGGEGFVRAFLLVIELLSYACRFFLG